MSITSNEARKLGILPARGNKYGARKTEYNGVTYASKAEAERAAELDGLLESCEIAWWLGQVKFRLGVPEHVYVADFLVARAIPCSVGTAFVIHAEDCKGYETAKFRRDKKLWHRYGRFDLHVLKRSGNGWKKEIITP